MKDRLRLALYLIALAALAWLVVRWWPELSALWKTHALAFLGVTLLVSSSIALQAITFRLFLPADERPSLLAVVRIWGVASLVNYLGPLQPGVFARVAMLNQLGVSLARSTVATLRQITASIWIATGLTGGALLCLQVPGTKQPGYLCLLAFALYPVCIGSIRRAAAALLSDRKWVPQTLRRHLPHALEMPSLVASAGVFALYCGGTAILLYGYAAFGADVDLAIAVLMACGVYVSSLVSLLPGNLGVSETIYLIGGHSMGLSISEAAALALLLRTAHVAASAALAISLHPWRGRCGAI
ncbi:MAG TPA: lysylphosphatidylglycerol synthase domain-containing protein [Luteimonas sp.]|nr:lysylphosphatidylglycerol synthase domain-containing protein [Luteimonas sp.]